MAFGMISETTKRTNQRYAEQRNRGPPRSLAACAPASVEPNDARKGLASSMRFCISPNDAFLPPASEISLLHDR
jgi:hypothetical protein